MRTPNFADANQLDKTRTSPYNIFMENDYGKLRAYGIRAEIAS